MDESLDRKRNRMPTRTSSPRTARVALILRAAVAAVAAIVVTFVQDRTGDFALLVFLAFLIATLAVLVVDMVLRGLTAARWALVLAYSLGILVVVTVPGPADARFHIALLIWAAAAGIVELASGLLNRTSVEARDRITVGVLTCVLAIVTLVVSPGYSLDYFVEEAGQSFTLTGTIIGVGLFGGWAAIIAVYLGIGALSPAQRTAVAQTAVTKDAS